MSRLGEGFLSDMEKEEPNALYQMYVMDNVGYCV